MKKYFDKFKDLKSTNKKLYYATICMFVLVGFTFAYVIDQISGGAISKIFITADTSDSLEFEVDKDISIKPSQFNFTQGGENLSDNATATARLKANSTDKTARYTYNVYLLIEKNEYIYTTEDKKPEMLLQVTTPNGEMLSEIDGLTYNNNLEGFDITELEKLIVISNKYEITSNSNTSYTEQNWIIKVSFINLETNQIDNEGKTLEAKIIIQKEELGEFNINVNGSIPLTVGNYANITCADANAVWNQKYNQVEVSGVSSTYNFCNMTYSTRTDKQYLNEFVNSLAGTSQGNGNVSNETAKIPNFNDTTPLNESQYGEVVTKGDSTNDWPNFGTVMDNIFSFSSGQWQNIPENMSSNKYYNISFTPEEGYYQICYSINKSLRNRLYFYLNSLSTTDTISINSQSYIVSSSNSEVSGCVNLGYLDGVYSKISVVQYAYGNTENSIATVKLELKKVNSFLSTTVGTYYKGENPNNYVWFNEELWRIIGVFDESNHGQKDQKLVKLIKDDSIGTLVWDNDSSVTSRYGQNDWKNATLKKLLNEYYYLSENGNDTDYCYSQNKKGKPNCNYINTGIKSNYKKMIKRVNWHLGEILLTKNVDDLYAYENGLIFENNEIYNDYIGLIYPSDSIYTSNYNIHDSFFKGNGYDKDNWLGNITAGWTISNSPLSSQNSVIGDKVYYSAYGKINYTVAAEGKYVRPTIYLDSSIYIISGDGSYNNPYIIGM